LIQTRDNENVFVLRTWLGKLAMPMPSKDLAVAIGREQGDTTSKTEVVKEVSMQFCLFVFIWIVAHFQQGPGLAMDSCRLARCLSTMTHSRQSCYPTI
jgi:hypothetical protein